MTQPIANAEQAIDRASLLTGLAKISDKPAAQFGSLHEDVTPFLGEGNIGKGAWRVVFPNSELKFASATPGFKDPYRRTFAVFLEAATGTLFYVASTYEGEPDPNMRPMPSCGEATEQLSNEEEVYNGYPAEDPKIDLLGALELILHGGGGSPFMAKQIHAVYVLHSYMGSTPQPAWVITLRGLPPFSAHGPDPSGVPVWQRNHLRSVVDAVIGRVMFATNSPQPL